MVNPTERRITEGGRRLLAHIRASGMNIPEWCAKHRLDRVAVTRVTNGERWKCTTVNLASAICRAVRAEGGTIDAEQFDSVTARAPKRRASVAA